MSKSKKRITNEKRERLGTGAGIAASKSSGSGGVPLWGWIVGAIVAVVVIGGIVGFVMNQSSSSGQSASCVQSRLSKETLDPVSLPTWPANYDDLQCALDALGLKPSTEGQGSGVHYHVHLTMYVDGKQIEIPDYIGLPQAGGMTSTSTSEIHTHGRETDPTPGVIHIESPSGTFRANLQQFFDVWGVYAATGQMGGYTEPVKAWVNGKPVDDWLTVPLQEHNAVTIVVGDEPADFKPDTSFKFQQGE